LGTSWAPIYHLTAGQGDWRRVPVAALLREGGGHLLGISRGAASPPGPDLWLWRPKMGQCWSLRANQACLMAEGVCGVRRCLRPLGKARRVLAVRAPVVRRMPPSLSSGLHGGDAMCCAPVVRLFLGGVRCNRHSAQLHRLLPWQMYVTCFEVW
jgi:hypothetical protein